MNKVHSTVPSQFHGFITLLKLKMSSSAYQLDNIANFISISIKTHVYSISLTGFGLPLITRGR